MAGEVEELFTDLDAREAQAKCKRCMDTRKIRDPVRPWERMICPECGPEGEEER